MEEEEEGPGEEGRPSYREGRLASDSDSLSSLSDPRLCRQSPPTQVDTKILDNCLVGTGPGNCDAFYAIVMFLKICFCKSMVENKTKKIYIYISQVSIILIICSWQFESS